MDVPDLNYDIYRRILENSDWKSAINLCNNLQKKFQFQFCNDIETKQTYVNQFLLGYKPFYQLPLNNILRLIEDLHIHPYYIFINKDNNVQNFVKDNKFKDYIIKNYIGNFPYLYEYDISTIINILVVLYPIDDVVLKYAENESNNEIELREIVERMIKLGRNENEIVNFIEKSILEKITYLPYRNINLIPILKLALDYAKELLYNKIAKLLGIEESIYDLLNNSNAYINIMPIYRRETNIDDFIQSRANYLLYCNIDKGRKIKDYNNINNILYSKYPLLLYNKYKDEWDMNSWKGYFLDKEKEYNLEQYTKHIKDKKQLEEVLKFQDETGLDNINKITFQDIINIIIGNNNNITDDIFEYTPVNNLLLYLAINSQNYEFMDRIIRHRGMMIHNQLIWSMLVLSSGSHLSDSSLWELIQYSQKKLPDLYNEFYTSPYLDTSRLYNIYTMFMFGLGRSLHTDDEVTRRFIESILIYNFV